MMPTATLMLKRLIAQGYAQRSFIFLLVDLSLDIWCALFSYCWQILQLAKLIGLKDAAALLGSLLNYVYDLPSAVLIPLSSLSLKLWLQMFSWATNAMFGPDEDQQIRCSWKKVEFYDLGRCENVVITRKVQLTLYHFKKRQKVSISG